MFEPITDPVYLVGKKKIRYYKSMVSKAGGSGKKTFNLKKTSRIPQGSNTPYKNPYEGKSAWDAYLADPLNYIPPK